jgi:hypothetical protein
MHATPSVDISAPKINWASDVNTLNVAYEIHETLEREGGVEGRQSGQTPQPIF